VASAEPVDWDTCEAEDGCIGAAVADGRCLAHLDDEELPDVLGRLLANGSLDVRGVRVSGALLERIVAVLPERDGRRGLRSPRFDRATFEGGAWFAETTFEGDARFDAATFAGAARFDGAKFPRVALAEGAKFPGGAYFEGAKFPGGAYFRGATFEDVARFDGATFEGGASFHRATFASGAVFDGAKLCGALFEGTKFPGDAYFRGATFEDGVWFRRASFEGAASFRRATFEGIAWFDGATFGQTRDFGPVDVSGTLILDSASFLARPTLEVGADQLPCQRIRFPEGASLRLTRGDVALDEAQFGRASVLAGPPQGTEGTYSKIGSSTSRNTGAPEVPRVVSLRRADVGNLVLSDVDLRACRFYGAHNLDRLRFEGAVSFPVTPSGTPWRRTTERGWPWTRRQTLAEEQEWRLRSPSRDAESLDRIARRKPQWVWRRWASVRSRVLQGKRAGWYGAECRPPQWLTESDSLPKPDELEPEQIAPLYRALRKGREDSKDEPGAADFYYGEMEMRRKATTTSAPERFILSLYWLVSGYGLRASRALAALLVTVVLFAALLYLRRSRA
jgi:uncharacterized protein YjbI with pentapeptide repeats